MANYPYQVPSGVTIVPEISGQSSLGTAALPFSNSYASQYATTLVSISGITGTNTVNWNNGSSQSIDFTAVASGIATIELTNGIAGSSYIIKTKQNETGDITVAWSGSYLWRGGSTGTLTATSGTIDLFSFYCDGSVYLGNAANDYK